MKKKHLVFFIFGFFTVILSVFVQSAFAGELTLGAQYDGWTTNFVNPVNGTEFWFPYSVSFNLNPDLNVYGQGEYGVGSYTPSNNGPETTNLSDFSDTLVGTQMRFKNFGLPALLNVGVYIPTGDSTWEGKQSTANIPLEFMGSRYTGEGFGINALYGLSFPSGTGEFGAAAGYSNMESYNSDLPAIPAGPYKPGDAMFLAVNHVQPHSNNQSEIVRLTGFAYLPTQVNGQNYLQLGPSFAGAYSWLNPKGLSFEVGGQYYFPMDRLDISGTLAPEANEFLAPRLYLNPSYAFGDFSLAASLAYIFQNGYGVGDPLYDGGGFLAGISPSYKLKLDSTSDINLTGAYYFIDHQKSEPDAALNYVDADYNFFSFGATYEVRL